MFDEELLVALDATAEVSEKDRPAVLRRLASEFVLRQREAAIDAQYDRAYRGMDDPLAEEFEGWELEGVSGEA